MNILAIETSCDETAAAVVSDAHAPGASWVKSSVVASQDDVHQRYGGVVPELASRRHVELLPSIVQQALERADTDLGSIDGVAVTASPGLIAALWVGVAHAKALAYSINRPLIAVNHLAAHLAAVLLDGKPCPWPNLGLLVSGGHTNLYWGEAARGYRLLATTRDDAAGEAFDKVAKLLGLGYPGGREIEQRAKGAPMNAANPLPKSKLKSGEMGFTFSGLKTAVAQWRQKQPEMAVEVVAHAFQERVFETLSEQVEKSMDLLRPRALIFSGGVAANRRLRQGFEALCQRSGIAFKVPDFAWCTDNAAMIGALGLLKLRAGQKAPFDLRAQPYETLQSDFDPEFFPPVQTA